MPLVEQQRLLEGRRRRLGMPQLRCQGGAAALECSAESADGTWGEAELAGDSGGRVATLPARVDLLSQGV
jgi:hypothetical protein